MSGRGSLARARRLLALPHAWIEPRAGDYLVRTGPDRRARVALTLDEAGFRDLVRDPGLRARPGGGWRACPPPRSLAPAPLPGRPGVIEGVRTVAEADGRMVERRANLAQTSVAWLVSHAGPDGRPWLDRAEAAAAARLALDAEAVFAGAALTMRWDAPPRLGARDGAARGRALPERRLAAASRVSAALAACGPARGIVEQVCVRATPLQAAEQGLGLRRRSGKWLLKQGLQALARHYRLT